VKLSHWRKALASTEKECRARNEKLREQKQAISKHYQGALPLPCCLLCDSPACALWERCLSAARVCLWVGGCGHR
jgi:hypothetical protein